MSDNEAHAPTVHPEVAVLRQSRRRSGTDPQPGEGLRERKKRMTRQQISDTATGMFLDQGFDEVRVSDVAAACGVSEKTVYNYFPTKESLLFDREPEMIEAVRRALGPEAPPGSPVDAFVDELMSMVDQMTQTWADIPGEFSVKLVLQRMHQLIEETPSLRAAYRDMSDRIAQAAAEELAERAGLDPNEPEPQVAAIAICALWGVMYRALERHVDDPVVPDEVRRATAAEVYRAARLIDTGLWSFGLEVQGTTSLEHVKQAADAANEARKQVVVAVRAAKSAWSKVSDEARAHQVAASSDRRRGGRAGARGAARGAGGGRRAAAVAAHQQREVQEEMRTARREAAKAKKDLANAAQDVAKATAELRAAAREAKRKR